MDCNRCSGSFSLIFPHIRGDRFRRCLTRPFCRTVSLSLLELVGLFGFHGIRKSVFGFDVPKPTEKVRRLVFMSRFVLFVDHVRLNNEVWGRIIS